MYQDKIKKEAKEALTSKSDQRQNTNIFVKFKIEPLNFAPDEVVCDATHIARDILSNRKNEEVIVLSKAIDSMLLVGENLLQSLAIKLLDPSNSRTSINLTQGRALYLLCDYFDLTTTAVKKVKWCEMFAVLTLMQVAEITFMQTKTYGDDDLSQALKLSAKACMNHLAEETIDSIARAECFFDKKQHSTSTGSKGGTNKAKRMEPLITAVIRLYMEKHTNRSNRYAAKLIEDELTKAKSPLLSLSSAGEKNVEFAKWIGKLKNGKIKLPIGK